MGETLALMRPMDYKVRRRNEVSRVLIRQSDIKAFQRCALQWKFQNIIKAPREQSSALSFGTALHDAVMVMELARDPVIGVTRFKEVWSDLSILDIEYDTMIPGNTHQSYLEKGIQILQDWWKLIQWETDVVLAREHQFWVPLGEHTLTGTVDKLAIRTLKFAEQAVLISDYKTSAKLPTREYLKHDIQFSAYAYATTQPEFWKGIKDGDEIHANLLDARRLGEWVHLRGPRRVDAGFRDQINYNRLLYAADAISASIECGIFIPTIEGSVCEFCPYRRICGLRSLDQEE